MKLKDLRKTRIKIQRLNEESDFLYAMLYNTHKKLSEVRVETSITNKREDLLIKAMEVTEMLNKEIMESLDEIMSFFVELEKVKNEASRQAIRLYYIGDSNKTYTYREIGEVMGYSESHIRKLIYDGINKMRNP